MTAGLRSGDGRLHFAGIKFRNTPPPAMHHHQIEHEIMAVGHKRSSITAGSALCECVKHVSRPLPSLICAVAASYSTLT